MKNSLKKKKKKTRTNFVPTRTNFVPRCHQVRLVKNFDLHQMSACVHENLYIAHEDVLERNAKFLKKKKKKLVPILYQNATGSDWLRILT